MDRQGSVSGRSTASAEELASELLALKKESGLSFAQLGEKTHYAKSSWERWVNGKQFPPRAAVESFAQACETPSARLLELWDRADEEREAGAGAADGDADGATGEAVPAPRRRRLLWLSAVLGVVLAAGAALTYVTVASSDDEPSSRPSPPVKIAGPATGCTGTGCEGKDPKKMNCSADAVTVRTGSIPKDLVIELRYSKACQAGWGRISFAEVGATVVVNNSDGAAAADVVHYDRDVYTPLIAAPEKGSTWVCASLPKGPQSCTGYFLPSQER